MASPELVDRVERDEGLRLEAYPDPRSPLAQACRKAGIDFTRHWRDLPNASDLSGHPWTIGHGHTGPEVHPGLVWTAEKARAMLILDLDRHIEELIRKEPWITNLDPVRRDVLYNMAFNLGIGYPPAKAGAPGKGLRAFVNTLAAVRRGDWKAARDGMLASAWASQVGDRAKRLAKAMETGIRP